MAFEEQYMERATTTFPCPQCDKVYLTQHSLTRHSHNHKKTSEHICPSCNVVFYRKDLLARHLKMHQGNRGGRRIRCHTACINCRDARIKCDSNKPCASCTLLGKQCAYSAKSARVSTNSRIKTSEDSEGSVETARYSEDRPAADETSDSGHLPAQTAFKETSNIDPSISATKGLEESIDQPDALDGLNGLDFSNLSPGQMTAWPWLHEDLFLQENWGGWTGFEPAFMGGAGLTQTDMTGNYLGPVEDATDATATRDGQFTATSNAVLAAGNSPQQTVMPQPNSQNSPATIPTSNRCEMPQSASYTQGSDIATTRQVTGAASIQQREYGARVTNIQMAVVSDLVAYARQASLEPPSRGGHVSYWYSMSMQVREAFNIYSGESPNASALHCLDHLVHLYWDNFWALWPMISAHAFHADSISPVLYLAMSSIGAMYGGPKASHFGVLLHEALRELLCEPMLTSEEGDSSSLSLAQARLLTQVAALYFGQKKAFSYAQHLGSVLIAQTRRMDLYSPSRHQRELSNVPSFTYESAQNSKWLARWLLAESRKRLAYGILRAEVYTSVLLNARPMLCAEEVALDLPCSSYLWLTKFNLDSQFIAAIRQDAISNISESMPFSDIVRITTEQRESTPPLNVVSQELLIFGLQEQVWRLCHDPDKLVRLTGAQIDSKDIYIGLDETSRVHGRSPSVHNVPRHRSGSMNSSSYSLDSRIMTGRSRQMSGLRSDYKTTTSALHNWRQLLSTHSGERTRSDRTSLMSGLLLFHISFLRILAPIEKLHHISYRIGSETGPDQDIVDSAWTWSQSRHATIAVQHACIIWSLLYQECNRSEDTRAWFNFLALLGMHHAAAVVWTYAKTHRDETSDGEGPAIIFTGAERDNRVPIVSTMSRDLMTLFIKLYGFISPAWSVRSSFSAAAVRLANSAFSFRPD